MFTSLLGYDSNPTRGMHWPSHPLLSRDVFLTRTSELSNYPFLHFGFPSLGRSQTRRLPSFRVPNVACRIPGSSFFPRKQFFHILLRQPLPYFPSPSFLLQRFSRGCVSSIHLGVKGSTDELVLSGQIYPDYCEMRNFAFLVTVYCEIDFPRKTAFLARLPPISFPSVVVCIYL